MNERVDRDFFSRDAEEQSAFLTHTWCNACMEVDLGMTDPIEYEQDGTVFIEGKCQKCGQTVTTELAEDDGE